MKKKIIVTGSNGLIGSKFMARWRNSYDLIPFDLSGMPAVDITDPSGLASAFNHHSEALGVLHLAAYTDVTGAFKQTNDKTGSAWQVNVVGTANLAALCQRLGLHLVHLSTAYVFNGERKELYTETAEPQPIEWYGQTKLESERVVQASGAKALILRIDQPFDREPFAKVDTLYRIINGLRTGTLYPQFTNHFFGPTYIDDLGKIIDFAFRHELTGLYHASSGEQWSDYDFARLVQQELGLAGEIKTGNLDDYLQTLARPYQRNTALSNAKLKAALDFKLKTIKQAVQETKL
jgi:dTDP-4-dehydrorhamnose reductase